jgi:hypothetical protein
MSVEPKWYAREQWTLIEAAQIVAGVNPYQGGKATDNPHMILAQITDPDRRALFDELYARSKDDIYRDALERGEPSRTGAIGNTRVTPCRYVMWAIDCPMPERLAALIDKAALAPVFGEPLPSKDTDPNKYGYTIEGAAKAIAEKYGVPERNILDRIREATVRGELTVRDPKTGFPFAPKVRRDFWERVDVADLNSWLEKSGVPYRLDVAPVAPVPTPPKKWDDARRNELRGEHARLVAERHTSPTKTLAKKYGVSEQFIREMKKEPAQKPNPWSNLVGRSK